MQNSIFTSALRLHLYLYSMIEVWQDIGMFLNFTWRWNLWYRHLWYRQLAVNSPFQKYYWIKPVKTLWQYNTEENIEIYGMSLQPCVCVYDYSGSLKYTLFQKSLLEQNMRVKLISSTALKITKHFFFLMINDESWLSSPSCERGVPLQACWMTWTRWPSPRWSWVMSCCWKAPWWVGAWQTAGWRTPGHLGLSAPPSDPLDADAGFGRWRSPAIRRCRTPAVRVLRRQEKGREKQLKFSMADLDMKRYNEVGLLYLNK